MWDNFFCTLNTTMQYFEHYDNAMLAQEKHHIYGAFSSVCFQLMLIVQVIILSELHVSAISRKLSSA